MAKKIKGKSMQRVGLKSTKTINNVRSMALPHPAKKTMKKAPGY